MEVMPTLVLGYIFESRLMLEVAYIAYENNEGAIILR